MIQTFLNGTGGTRRGIGKCHVEAEVLAGLHGAGVELALLLIGELGEVGHVFVLRGSGQCGERRYQRDADSRRMTVGRVAIPAASRTKALTYKTRLIQELRRMGARMKHFVIPFVSLAFLTGCNNAAEEAVRRELVDPDSAQFREVKTCSGDPNISTGEVNGKNRMGAYTGFEPFFVEGGRVFFAATDGFVAAMNKCYGSTNGSGPDGGASESATSPAADTGGWITNTDRDPIDDSAVITAMLTAESGQAKFGEPVTLVARCGSNKTELYALWHEYVGDDSNDVYDEYKKVEVRVGDAPARTERWNVSTDKQATFAGSAVSLLKEMGGKKKLALRTTPYGENPITAIFNLEGFEKAVAPIAKECGWQL
jgi:hypothetical protein